jgi:alanyl-tRNA synthetase
LKQLLANQVIEYLRQSETILSSLSNSLKAGRGEILEKVESILSGRKALENELKHLKAGNMSFSKERIEKEAIKINDDISLIYQEIDNADPKIMREVVENTTKLSNNLVVIFISKTESKLSLIVGISNNISSKYKAAQIVKEIASKVGIQGGGGSDLLAQAGGNITSDISELKKMIVDLL